MVERPGRRTRRRTSRALPGRSPVALLAATTLVALAGAAALGAGPAAAAPSAPAFSTPIQHIVFIVQENHSFDNVLGYWCVETGRCDGATTGQLSNGTTIPLTEASDIVTDVSHVGSSQIEAIDGGKMDGFNLIGGCRVKPNCYSQYLPSQIPNLTSLASHFTVSDHTFIDGPVASWGMKIDAVAADLDGFQSGAIPQVGIDGVLGPGWGCDSGDDAFWTSPLGVGKWLPSCIPDPALNKKQYPYGGAYRATSVPDVPTIMDELDAAGLSWRIYGGLGGTENSNGYGWSICPTFAGCIDTKQAQNLVPQQQAVTDAKSGNLPNFSVITPTQFDSQHNFDSMTAGDNWIGQITSAIMHGPDWSSTAIFLTYDECGCFYDHVAPPAGMSIRVPMIIISPYAIAGHDDSTVASHASVLAFTEHDFHLPALSSLDGTAYDYSGSFDFSQQPLKPVAMVTTPIPAAELASLKAHPPPADDPS